VCPHRPVSVNVDAEITHEADWRKQVATDSKLIRWQLMLTVGRRIPQKFDLSCDQLKSVRFHPVHDGGDALSNATLKVVSGAGSTRAVDLCVVGVQMRLQSEGLNQPHQVHCIQQKQDRPEDRTLWHPEQD